jgi:hypothetical protein
MDQDKWLIGLMIILLLAISLKLMACSIQQKIIGAQLSRNPKVLEMCGVHTPFMQAIKRLLEPKGMTLAKVSILAGGPDWPTSVLAGILGIDLLPCLFGTLPCFLLSSSSSLAGAMMARQVAGIKTTYNMLATVFLTSAIAFNLM